MLIIRAGVMGHISQTRNYPQNMYIIATRSLCIDPFLPVCSKVFSLFSELRLYSFRWPSIRLCETNFFVRTYSSIYPPTPDSRFTQNEIR